MTTPLYFMSEQARTVLAVEAPIAVGEDLESCVRGYHVLLQNQSSTKVLTIILPSGMQGHM